MSLEGASFGWVGRGVTDASQKVLTEQNITVISIVSLFTLNIMSVRCPRAEN